jgi:DNA-binding MarR family transcriptional regulator
MFTRSPLPRPRALLDKQQYAALSEFRFRLTRFQRFSKAVALASGISPLQYLLLLHLRGFRGREWASVGELAERLDASHQGTVALVQRCEANGLVTKNRSALDARRVEIHLTARARKLVERIASRHRDELARLAEVFRGAGLSDALRPGRKARRQSPVSAQGRRSPDA